MKLCPICKKTRRELQKIVKGKDKKWLISFCGACLFNFEIEESDGGTPQKDIMDKPGIPLFENGTFI
jgi:hypothetical protein